MFPSLTVAIALKIVIQIVKESLVTNCLKEEPVMESFLGCKVKKRNRVSVRSQIEI